MIRAVNIDHRKKGDFNILPIMLASTLNLREKKIGSEAELLSIRSHKNWLFFLEFKLSRGCWHRGWGGHNQPARCNRFFFSFVRIHAFLFPNFLLYVPSRAPEWPPMTVCSEFAFGRFFYIVVCQKRCWTETGILTKLTQYRQIREKKVNK